jgi:shikimate dehydrogenase
MGWPVSHSLSPRLHGFWLKLYGIAGSYDAFAVRPEAFPATLRSLSAQGLRGVNLTVPHKEAACAIVDRLDPTAQRIGAVNLVTVEADGRLLGRNTDAYGFAHNLLTSGFAPRSRAALVLGAGGASRAVIVALADMGFSDIRVANRTAARAEKLAQEFSTAQVKISVSDWKEAPNDLKDIELLVNTTSLGMKGQPALDIPLDTLPGDATVTDIVYTPLETDLLRQARQRGHRAIDGLGMLLHQARPAFAAFYVKDPQVTQELRNFVLAEKT